MWNLHSMTKNVDVIRHLFGALNSSAGNLPSSPGIIPDYPEPIVRNAPNDREIAMARWGMRPQKITFGDMREMGVRGVLVYCADHHCSHSVALSADRWPGEVRLSDIEPRFVCRACGKRGADVRPDFNCGKVPGGACSVEPDTKIKWWILGGPLQPRIQFLRVTILAMQRCVHDIGDRLGSYLGPLIEKIDARSPNLILIPARFAYQEARFQQGDCDTTNLRISGFFGPL